MVDEMFDRNYQAGREALNGGIDRVLARLAGNIGAVMTLLHQIQWQAPWKADDLRRIRRHRGGLA